MEAFHPAIVHFPIALLLTGVIAEVASLVWRRSEIRSFALGAPILGTLGLVGAYLSGHEAEEAVEHLPGTHGALEAHEELAAVTMWTWLVLLGLRVLLTFCGWLNSPLFVAYVVLCVAGGVMIGMTGYRGGERVYKYGAGVQLMQAARHVDGDRAKHLSARDEDD